MRLTFTLDEIHIAAQRVIENSRCKIVLFNGEMGAGKTTLIKEIARQLGVRGATSSPTFSLVNEYHINDSTMFYHFDLYRLRSESEALDIGIEDYLFSGHWCLIEWPEKVPNLIPEAHTVVNLHIMSDDKRSIDIL